ncbi:MAG TPA: wax ester/triacylglycerol synthase domain-containing protein [Iamia sp.]|nr:wax ester/triacylglycerol synthase domain-containing protein [Iamia sp.]
MSDSDALMWTIEKDAMLRSTITAVAVLDRAPDHDRLRHLLDRGTRLVPRLRQRVRANPLSIAPPRWEVDPNFDLDYHVRFARAAGTGDLRSVLDMAQPIAMAGFDRARPLWEATLIEGMEDDRAALVLKVHHAITDGVGSIKLALIMFELERDAAAEDLPDAPEAFVMSQAARWVDAIAHEQRRALGIARRSGSTVAGSAVAAASSAVSDPGGTVARVRETVESVARLAAPASAPLSPLMTGRSLSVRFDTIVVPMAAAKAAARAAGATLNDAFVAATCSGFARYHSEMGASADALRMTMPINVRTAGTEDVAGNQFVPARFPIPLDLADPVERMQVLHELVLGQRGEPSLGFVEPMAGLLRRLPTSLSTGLFGSMLKGVDLVTSNVPGAPIPIYTAGGRVEALYALGPLTGAAANLTLLSYLDDLHIGVNVDPAAVTEPDRLVAALRAGWDELLAVAAPVAPEPSPSPSSSPSPKRVSKPKAASKASSKPRRPRSTPAG